MLEHDHEQIKERKCKLAALRQTSKIVYPNDFKRTDLAADLHAAYDAYDNDMLEKEARVVKLAGRMMQRRLMGKASFMQIQDMTGVTQIYLKVDAISLDRYEAFKHWDLGDLVGVVGVLFKTKTGELSIKASDIQLITKSLRPMPDKYHGLANHELRVRRRYLDLLVTPKSRAIFRIRSEMIAKMRAFLNARRFIEVETPMLHTLPGGAAAKPFKTHHNALDMQLFLRIAPELFLKRLVVGGFEKVYEINRNFRNEGISTRHNPEFTMLEFYEAYADYADFMTMTEALMPYLAQEVLGLLKVPYQNHVINFEPPFEKYRLRDAILKWNPDIQPDMVDHCESAKVLARQHGIDVLDYYGLGKIQMELFEKLVERKLIQPTFITHFPKEVSPLSRVNNDNDFLVDRFEFYVGGQEIANAFSELNDPEDQADRFRAQLAMGGAGDEEAMRFDADYIEALEYGMPPTAGEGIGIDRLVMLFTDSPSIRDVILFPLLRDK